MKVCTSCRAEKPFSDFHNDKTKKDGKVSRCIPCTRAYRASYYKINSEHLKQASRDWHAGNKDRAKARSRQYYLDNIETFREYRKAKYWSDRDANSKKSGEYHLSRLKTDPHYRFVARCRKRVWAAFFEKGYSKKTKTFALLGCSKEELISYIESKFKEGMTWDNYGEWHLDHKLPFSAAKNEREVEMLCHYTNLQPLWASDNVSKSARYCERELSMFFKVREIDRRKD